MNIARHIVTPGNHLNGKQGVEREGEPFIEIKGREGSKTIFRKRIPFLEDITDAEIQKLLGIAQRLPAVAFDALDRKSVV